MRDALRLEAGAELEVTVAGDAVVLSPAAPFPRTSLAQVQGCLSRPGGVRTLGEMDAGIRLAVSRRAARVAAGTPRSGKRD